LPDFLLELLTEEIPARMQARAIEQLRDRFTAGLAAAGLGTGPVASFVTPRRLVLHATGVAAASEPVSDERRGPRTDAPDQAISGFVKSIGLPRDAMEARDTPKGRFLYATIVTPGRSAEAILADLIPAIVRDFDWPKSMRWGAASVTASSPRWVRPLSGIVALLGDAVVPFAAAGVTSGRTTFGHRFMSTGPIEIPSATTYVGQLFDAKVQVHYGERVKSIILERDRLAAMAGLRVVEDSYLVDENAGLTEWPVPLLGRFDPAFLDVPREVIQLTMRTNQKYFACADADGNLAPAFVAIANIAASDGGSAIVAGNRKVLAARLADAKFFWDADLARVRDGGLASFTPKLKDIVFHEKLGTVADKVERVAKLARWLVTSGAVGASPRTTRHPRVRGDDDVLSIETLAALAETAARLCKADLVSATVGEFPEVQGIAGGRLALAQGLDPQIAAAIRDHYKPVGPSDEVPTAPITVAVALADKLDTLAWYFAIDELPTGSRDPFALRRSALGIISLVLLNRIRLPLLVMLSPMLEIGYADGAPDISETAYYENVQLATLKAAAATHSGIIDFESWPIPPASFDFGIITPFSATSVARSVLAFLADRLKVQQREAGIRPDVIDAVFSLGGEDDLVRLVSRAKALQAVLQTPDGASLLAGYRRGANIVRIEEAKEAGVSGDEVQPDRLTEPAEIALNAALDAAVPAAETAVAAEDFTAAMTALARLRPAVDAFFEQVTVNANDQTVRRNRLALLARLRTAVHTVADFSKIEG
jgi:glycyl-tRNA synthetase beta chain